MSLYDIFSNLCGKAPRIVQRKPDKRTGKVYQSISFKSLNIESLNYYSELFYIYKNDGLQRKIKIVPGNIKDLLTPRALAYWIMDDGGINSYKATQLNTDSFTLEQIQLLQQALLENFQLRTRLAEKRAGQWIIVIPIKQPLPLSAIVGPYMHSSMRYKIKGLF